MQFLIHFRMQVEIHYSHSTSLSKQISILVDVEIARCLWCCASAWCGNVASMTWARIRVLPEVTLRGPKTHPRGDYSCGCPVQDCCCCWLVAICEDPDIQGLALDVEVCLDTGECSQARSAEWAARPTCQIRLEAQLETGYGCWSWPCAYMPCIIVVTVGTWSSKVRTLSTAWE